MFPMPVASSRLWTNSIDRHHVFRSHIVRCIQSCVIVDYCSYLQAATVDDLVVDRKLATLIRDDKNADATTAVVEGVRKTAEEAALIEDGKTLLDITSLGHGDDTTILADVQHAVLLEDRTDHVLNDHGWAWVADEGGLLVKLLAEEIHTEVAVLTGLSRGGDADDLAWASLEDEEIANADMVAWDGDGVGWAGRAGRAALFGVAWSTHADFLVSDDNVLFTLNVDVFVSVVAGSFEWVTNLLGGAVESVTQAVVVAVFVVISHVAVAVFLRTFDDTLFLNADGITLGGVLAGVGGLVFPTGLLCERSGTGTEVSFGNVDSRIEVDVSGWSVTGRVFAVVITILNVDLSVGVTLEWFAVAIPVNVNLYASVDSVFAAVSPVTSEALLFGDVDVLAVSIVSSSIPSSALDSDFLLSSDFGFRGLVAVARWEDAERDRECSVVIQRDEQSSRPSTSARSKDDELVWRVTDQASWSGNASLKSVERKDNEAEI